MKNFSLLALALLGAHATGAHAQSANDLKGPAPVSISSANYRETPPDRLIQLNNGKSTLNPEPRALAPLATPKHFIFLPGEIFESDLTYEEVCARLSTALAQKNYLNGADPQGLIREPGKITLVLRVSFGERPWRLPTVRTEQLAWKDGLQPRSLDPRSLTNLGADTVFENRAGGNDNALAAASANASAGSKVWGGSSGSAVAAGGAGSNALANGTALGATAEYDGTRNFNLIVIDAFDYAELKSKGRAATRLWTTFVAAPRQPGQKFSDVLGTLLRSAGPYWGETTSGMQVFSDARAEVKIGEIIEVPATPPVAK